jgi:hypothetical protein
MAAGHLALFLENLYLRSQLHDLENELGQQRAAGSGAREPSDTTTSGDI